MFLLKRKQFIVWEQDRVLESILGSKAFLGELLGLRGLSPFLH